MPGKQILGVIGSILLFIGASVPLVGVPVFASLNLFDIEWLAGLIIVVLAVVSLVLACVEQYEGLQATGLFSLLGIIYVFVELRQRMDMVRLEAIKDLYDNPFGWIVDMTVGFIRLQWGWAFLVAGAALLLVTGMLRDSAGEEEEGDSEDA